MRKAPIRKMPQSLGMPAAPPAEGVARSRARSGAVPFRRTLWLMAAAVWLALACNAPQYLGALDATAPPPPPTMTPGDRAVAPTAAPIQTPSAEVTRIPLPTFTPIRSTRTPLATVPPGADPATPAITETPTITPTATTSGPLRFSYELTWQLDPNNSAQAIATVRFLVAGGTGDYRYFHDDLPVTGPEFTYRWMACQANPGSLRVDSGNESVRVNYYVVAPCPSP